MNPNSRCRCALVCCFFIALFSAFSFRLIYLQVIKHDEYAELAAEKHVYKQIIYAERGAILDANNEVLAHNVPENFVVGVKDRAAFCVDDLFVNVFLSSQLGILVMLNYLKINKT